MARGTDVRCRGDDAQQESTLAGCSTAQASLLERSGSQSSSKSKSSNCSSNSSSSTTVEDAIRRPRPVPPEMCAVQVDGVLLIDCPWMRAVDDDDGAALAIDESSDNTIRLTEWQEQVLDVAVYKVAMTDHAGLEAILQGEASSETSLAVTRLRDINHRHVATAPSGTAGHVLPQPVQAEQSTRKDTTEKRKHRTEPYSFDDVKLHPFPAIVLHQRRQHAQSLSAARAGTNDDRVANSAGDALDQENCPVPGSVPSLPSLPDSAIKSMSRRASHEVGDTGFQSPHRLLRLSTAGNHT